MAHASRPTSIIFPADVTGFVILDETVSNCTEQKKAASPNPWIFPPFCPLSNTHMSTVPTAKTTVDSPNAITRRANSRRCRSPIVKSLDSSSRITADSPSALRSCARGSDDAPGGPPEARPQSHWPAKRHCVKPPVPLPFPSVPNHAVTGAPGRAASPRVSQEELSAGPVREFAISEGGQVALRRWVRRTCSASLRPPGGQTRTTRRSPSAVSQRNKWLLCCPIQRSRLTAMPCWSSAAGPDPGAGR
jgi:hypothetical protein